MLKKISVSELRSQLTTLLDQLEEGHSHFVIERNNQEVAVLLSMEKFQEIMQMVEMITTLDFIDAGSVGLTVENTGQEFPDLMLLPPVKDAEGVTAPERASAPRPRRSASSIEDMANKLGIRVIK